MHHLGHCMNYDNTRKFLTSSANETLKSKNKTNIGALVPATFPHKKDGGCLPVAVADNWDHLCRTVDGFNTDHVMTSALLMPSSYSVPSVDKKRMKKGQEKTFVVSPGKSE